MEKEKTNLEKLLWERGISLIQLKDVMEVSSKRTVYNKLHRVTQFTLFEMNAIRNKLFPEHTLEYIFEGYGELEQKGA